MTHSYFSQRTGTNPNINGQLLPDVIDMFVRVWDQFEQDRYFDEAFGISCDICGYKGGFVRDIELKIQLNVQKKNLWPIHFKYKNYTEDDFFDIIEFLFEHVSKPINGEYVTSFDDSPHWHWTVFNQNEGQNEFRQSINKVLDAYYKPFELSPEGKILNKPEDGLAPVIKTKVPSDDTIIVDNVNAAKLLYQRHKSSLEDRRHAVRDLVDVLEGLRPQIKVVFNTKDENDLFNIVNNFGIRHNNDKQKTEYDQATWLAWMFYYYLITIHVVLRKIKEYEKENTKM